MRPPTGVIRCATAQHLARLTVTKPSREAAPGRGRASATVVVGKVSATPAAPAIAAAVHVAVAAVEMVVLLLAPPGGLRVELPLPRLVVPVTPMAPSGHERIERIRSRKTLDPYQKPEKYRRDADRGGFGSGLGSSVGAGRRSPAARGGGRGDGGGENGREGSGGGWVGRRSEYERKGVDGSDCC